MYVHDMSHGTSRLVEFVPRTPCLVILHLSCYSTSRVNEDFHRKFLNFTCEYLRVTMHGPPHVSEVTLELYHM